MISIQSTSLLDELCPDDERGRCLAAAFCSFTFDPVFFEEHVLATVLRISSDPVEQTLRYLEEGRRALQETPVVCLVDAGMRKPGHRLPYDLLEVSSRVFHPKLALLLYEDRARLVVGSGNLTRGGFGDNTELHFARDLFFDDIEDAMLLQEASEFLERVHRLARQPGAQFALFQHELNARHRPLASGVSKNRSVQFLHSEQDQSLLQQFLNVLPQDAKISRIGAMAPYFERDDADAFARDEMKSVVEKLAERADQDCVFDIGVLWEDSPTGKKTGENPRFEDALGHLWGAIDKTEKDQLVTYLTIADVSARHCSIVFHDGVRKKLDRNELEQSRQREDIWYVGPPAAYAPAQIFAALREKFGTVNLWLHPAWRLENGRRVNRPLHAKLLTVTTTRRGTDTTYVLMGSPNVSRRALLQTRVEGANVECAVCFCMDGEVSIQEMAPELVWVDPAQTVLIERTFPDPEPNIALFVEAAIYDAAAKQLTISWAEPSAQKLNEWQMLYQETQVSAGFGIPNIPTLIENFSLCIQSCEIILKSGAREASIPITVIDLVALPVGPGALNLDLRELLALLGKRMGAERIYTLRTQLPASQPIDDMLESIFGESFCPTDVFKAWWGVRDDLQQATLSTQAVRLRLEGTLGVRLVWERIRDLGLGGDTGLSRDEAWFYGAELHRTLSIVQFAQGPGAEAKQSILADFLTTLKSDLEQLTPRDAERHWVLHVREFYGV